MKLLPFLFAAARAAHSCRYAANFTTQDIMTDPSSFIDAMLEWESKFHQDSVGYNTANGMTYDGTLINSTTGLHNLSGIHPFSAASKESLHNMILANAINGSEYAAKFVSYNNTANGPQAALDILTTKLNTYMTFNSTYPGYAGWLPWYSNNGSNALKPTPDFVNRVPALDNGENVWAIYAIIEALTHSNLTNASALASQWQSYFDYAASTAVEVFYNGTGHVCAVTDLSNENDTVHAFNQTYRCEVSPGADSPGFLDDPYEGELFTFFLQLFGNLTDNEKNDLWVVKRPQLVNVNYTMHPAGNITVQRGFWFSAHENWKLLELPYLDVPLVKAIFTNAEIARTCNSYLTANPGLYASVNNVTDASGAIIGYISNAGIPSISNQTVQELDVISPYGSMNTVLLNQTVGLAWYHNMLLGQRMQNPYGSSESSRLDGSATSAFVSWDSKITTINALTGGVQSLVRSKLQRDGLYDTFINITTREYSMKFSEPLAGSNIPMCLPNSTIPALTTDFTECSA